jgi:hypothetical protein
MAAPIPSAAADAGHDRLDELLSQVALLLCDTGCAAAEKALAGACVFGNETARAAARELDPGDWSDPRVRTIVRAALSLDAPDMIQVWDSLRDVDPGPGLNRWDMLIAECVEAFTFAHAIPGWARIIRERADERRRIESALQFLQKAGLRQRREAL